jgi:hypothetical protein
MVLIEGVVVLAAWKRTPRTVTATPEWKAIVEDVPKFAAPDAVTIIV